MIGFMRINEKQLRWVIRETLEQHMRGNLDPKPGHMGALEAHDPTKDYLLWAKTNGYDSTDLSAVATFALESGLDPEGVEIKSISMGLNLEPSAVSDIQHEMAGQGGV